MIAAVAPITSTAYATPTGRPKSLARHLGARRAVADDARAQQWRDGSVGEGIRKAIGVCLRYDGKVGVATVGVPACERGLLAQVLATGDAEAARSACRPQPCNADPI